MILLPSSERAQPPDEQKLYARSGWAIPSEDKLLLDPELVRIRSNEHVNWRRGIRIRSVSNYPYNCMGMVFASRREWIDIDLVYKVLDEDGYRQIAKSEAVEGDLVLYVDAKHQPSHIALIIGVDNYGETPNILVLSKWGELGEFVHHVENVAVHLGTPSAYYTERPE